MSIPTAILLGIVQGLTEFLPVSSSGHLVLAEALLGVGDPTAGGGVAFEVAVHLGTLLSVVVFFRARLLQIATGIIGHGSFDRAVQWRYIAYIAIGTIPAVCVGLFAKDQIETAFDRPHYAATALLVTGAFLLATRLARSKNGGLSPQRALIIGIAQAAAIMPGISRSGSTIGTGLFLGIDSEHACEFSFLLSIPAILGATVLMLPDAWRAGALGLEHITAGASAAIIGYIALHWVLAAIRTGRFHWFGVYCLILGTAALIWLA